MTRAATTVAVLVVDDDEVFLDTVATALENRGHAVTRAHSLREAHDALASRSFDAAVVDLVLGSESGLAAIPPLCAKAGAASVIAMSASASVSTVVEAMKLGAFDFLEKPFAMDRLVALLERASERARLARENATLRQLVAKSTPTFVPPERLGAKMRAIFAKATRAGSMDVPILINGETGVGKEFVAHAVHDSSSRREGPFIAVNSGSLAKDLIDSELFGHDKGAFTGARDLRLGVVEVARKGTLFLDEIGELPLEAQTKLLRLIEQGEFRRVGDSELRRADVRIVAATNRDLAREVENGRFRKDLLYRLDALSIRVPPLRERLDEIPVFVEAFLRARGAHEHAFPPAVMRALAAHDWPGNVRELRNQVDKLLLQGDPGTLGSDALSETLGRVAAPTPPQPARALPASQAEGSVVPLREHERRYLIHVLEYAAWNRRQAAEFLGIDPRTLYRKLKEHSIQEPRG